MQKYVATFHTHLSAMMSYKNLKEHGLSARMSPVPRSLSSSCGSCVRYEAPSPEKELMDRDVECIYLDDASSGYHEVTEDMVCQ